MIKIIITILILLLAELAEAHPVKDIMSSQKEAVDGYVNQARLLPIPFRKCFKVEPEL